MKPTSTMPPEFWVNGNFGDEIKAARILFGQTRDDVQVERFLVRQHGKVRRALVITSGGCGAMSLVDSVSDDILSVDINPAQNWLAELKLSVWKNLGLSDFHQALYGNAIAAYATQREMLSPHARYFWDYHKNELFHGLQNCGVLDGYTRRMARFFFATVHSRIFVREFLSLADANRQAEEYASRWDSWRWRFAMGVAFHPIFLRLALNRTVSILLPSDFAALMREKLAHWLTAHPAATNRSLWQSFFQSLPPDSSGWPLYLQPDYFASQKSHLQKIQLITTDVAEVLSRQEPGSLEFIGLSNILELCSPEQSREIMRLAAHATAAGGFLFSRSVLPQNLEFDEASWSVPEVLMQSIRQHDRGGLSMPALLLERCTKTDSDGESSHA